MSSRRSTQKFRRLNLESLEQRKMMASNILAVVNSSGDLIVTGDSGDNGIFLRLDYSSSQIQIESLFDKPTTINGQEGPVLLPAIGRNVIFDLKGGDDSVYFGDYRTWDIAGRISADLGSGNDDIGFAAVKVFGDVSVVGGSGKDQLSIGFGSEVLGAINAEMGSDKDWVVLADSQLGATNVDMGAGDDSLHVEDSVLAALAASLGSGNDKVIINDLSCGCDPNPTPTGTNVTLHGRSIIELGEGNDRLISFATLELQGKLNVTGGNGNDSLRFDSIDDNAAAGIVFELGAGDNTLGLKQLNSLGNLDIVGGTGSDDVSISNAKARNLNVETSSGGDKISVQASTLSSLKLRTTSGADQVTIQDVAVSGNVAIDGGSNKSDELDGLKVTNLRVGGKLVVRGFEVVG